MFERWVEGGLLDILDREGVGCIPFSPLAQGLLTNKYLKGIPEDSRAAKPTGFLQQNAVTPDTVDKIAKLNQLAQERGQSLAQMALSWILKDRRITSVLIGVSKVEQLEDCLHAYTRINFEEEQINRIDSILTS